MSSFTRDSISMKGAGVVTLIQPRHGPRITLDSIILADFCRIKKGDRILDAGAGVGIISILLAKKFPSVSITAVEIQHVLADICRRNIDENELARRVAVIEGDITRLSSIHLPGKFDAVVSNPPYIKSGAGRRSHVHQRQAARHDQAGIELWLDLEQHLKNRGRYYLIFAAARLAEVLYLLRGRRLEPKRLRLVHPYLGRPAVLALIEAVKGGGTGMEVLPPLIIHENGGYSEEMQAIYGIKQIPS